MAKPSLQLYDSYTLINIVVNHQKEPGRNPKCLDRALILTLTQGVYITSWISDSFASPITQSCPTLSILSCPVPLPAPLPILWRIRYVFYTCVARISFENESGTNTKNQTKRKTNSNKKYPWKTNNSKHTQPRTHVLICFMLTVDNIKHWGNATNLFLASPHHFHIISTLSHFIAWSCSTSFIPPYTWPYSSKRCVPSRRA